MTASTSPATYLALSDGRLADDRFRYLRAVRGFDPGEVLSPNDRRLLIRLLVEHRRWTDKQIAEHTRWSYLVVVRLREELLLPANPPASQK